jgi:hypothetical protein
VELVDHDEREAREESTPLRVVREHAGVQHVRVRQHDVAAVADQRPPAGWRVTVVDVDLELDRQAAAECAELGQLILGQRLGREEVERAARGLLQESLQDGQVVAERLPARGRRDDDEVLLAAGQLVGLSLVGVQPLDPAPAQRLDERWCEVGGQRARDRIPRWEMVVERDVTAQGAEVQRRHRAANGGGWVALAQVVHGSWRGR